MSSPDASASPRPEPSFKATEVLAYGAKDTLQNVNRLFPPEVQKRINDGLQRKKELEGIPSKKQRIETLAERGRQRKISAQQAETTKAQFGMGEAQVQQVQVGAEKQDKAVLDKNASVDARENFNSASAQIDKINKYLTYADIKRQADARNITDPIQLQKFAASAEFNGGKGFNAGEWATMRADALDAIISIEGFQDQFDELRLMKSDEQRRLYIENALGADPKVANTVSEKMQTILTKIKELPAISESPEVATARALKEAAEKRVDTSKDNIMDMVKTTLSLSAAGEKQLQTVIDRVANLNGDSVTIMHNIRQELYRQVPGSDIYINLKQAEQQQAALDALLKANPPETVGTIIKKAKPDEKRDQWLAQKAAVDKTLSSLKTVWEDNTRFPAAARATIQSSVDSINMLTADISSPDGPKSFMALEVAALADNTKQQKEAENELLAKEAADKNQQKENKAARAMREAELVRELEMVLPESIDEVLDERRREMTERVNQDLDEKEKAAAEKLDKETLDHLKDVAKTIKTRWIEYNPTTREKQTHHNEIGDDVRFLAYYGPDEGMKRLMIRDMALTDASGTAIDWKNIDLDTLSDDHKKLLEQAGEIYGDTYKTQLFKDFFEARRLRDSLPAVFGKERAGALHVQKHEWELLTQNFGPYLENKLKETEEGRAAIEKLEQKGITEEKVGDKKKWFLALLMAMGAGMIAVPVASAAIAAQKSTI